MPAPTARRARRALLGAKLALAALAIALWASCVSTARPPEGPADPLRVWLVREARHAGLLLPLGEGEWVEYGYGEWGWYALARDAWYHVFDTILWPTRGTLARRTIHARDERELRLARAPGELVGLLVERERAAELAAELEALYQERAAEEVRRSELATSFVPTARSFWFGHNCHDALADWLRRLGCEVSRSPIRGGIELRARE